MAHIRTRHRKKGPVFIAEVAVKGHPKLSKTFTRLSEAHHWSEDTEKALLAGGYVTEAPPGDLSFKEALDKYIDYIQTATRLVNKQPVPLKKPNTVSRENTAATPLHEHFDRFALRQITTTDCAEYRDKRLTVVSPSSFLKEMFVFNNVFKKARTEWGVSGLTNPFADIEKPSQGEGRLRFLTVAEAVKLYDNAKKSKNLKFFVYILLMLQSGMRPSEAAGLTWGKINLEKRYIDLTVTKTRPRFVPLTVPACAHLLSIQPDGWQPGDYVFLGGEPSNYVGRQPCRYFRKAFNNACEKAGIEDFTQHDMRHTAASHLLMTERVDLITLSNILGHTSLDMTRRYAHMLLEHKLKAVDRIAHLGLESENGVSLLPPEPQHNGG